MIDPRAPVFSDTPASLGRASFDYAPADLTAKPIVSIVTPFFNTREVFDETARSVLRQSLQAWEWLIINDATTDVQALAILHRYRSLDPRIRVIDLPENGGPSAARNFGYRSASTPYVLQLDSDNLLEPTAAEKWLWFLQSHDSLDFVKGYSVGFGAEEYLWTEGFHSGPAFLDKNMVDATSLVRRSVHESVGGYDETIRDGFEDWEFWLRAANGGHWGGTVPEFLDWYRRRPSHADRWQDWDNGPRQHAFQAKMRGRYANLWRGAFPKKQEHRLGPYQDVPENLPCVNVLQKSAPRILLIVPWLTMGGADRFNLDLTSWLLDAGWEVTIATTLAGDHSWMPDFARLTPDIFPLTHFLQVADYPRFLRYLIGSRSVDVVLTTHSEVGYLLLPYLRAHCPGVAFLDYCHLEEERWRNGGYPRISLEHAGLLDLTVVSSNHLKEWMVGRNGDPARTEVCYTGARAIADADPETRSRVREELGIPMDARLILFAGRIAAQKQPRVLVESLRSLRQMGVEFCAVIAGDGPEMAILRSAVARHRLGCVRLIGAVTEGEINRLMAASDVFFLPSAWEGIALSVFEAMAAGLPVVSADVGGQRELVTADCGILIPPLNGGNEEAARYAEALALLLCDDSRRRTMGVAGRARVYGNFAFEGSASRILELIEKARRLHLEAPRPRPSTAVARTCAFQTVEILRLRRLADELWAGRGRSQVPSPFQLRLYAAIARLLEPIYQWGVSRGWRWVAYPRAWIRRGVLGRT